MTENIELYSGEELSLKDISKVTYKFPYKLILIIGDFDSGKTTLLATIFDLFQIGSFKEFLFAGSLTMVGFEKRCHLSRVASGLTVPDTERTKSIEFSFLHLSIKKKNSQRKKALSLLLSDVSGERFKQARNSLNSMQEMGFIKNAEHTIMIIDGGKMADLKQRRLEIFNAQTFIDMALQAGNFNENTNLNIILSKWDLLSEDPSFNFYEIIEKSFNERYSGKIKSIKYSKIAARPLKRVDNINLGFGLHELLNEWCDTKKSTLNLFPTLKSTRTMNNYKYIHN